MLEEIKEAIEVLNNDVMPYMKGEGNEKHYKTLLALAQRYVEAVEPKMKTSDNSCMTEYYAGYNLALQDRILWELKCLEGIETFKYSIEIERLTKQWDKIALFMYEVDRNKCLKFLIEVEDNVNFREGKGD